MLSGGQSGRTGADHRHTLAGFDLGLKRHDPVFLKSAFGDLVFDVLDSDVIPSVTVSVDENVAPSVNVATLAIVTTFVPVPIITALEPVAAKVKVVPDEVSEIPVIAPVFVIAQVLDVPTMSLVTPDPEVKLIPAPEPEVFET